MLAEKKTYLPNKQVCLNKLYFQISNSKEKKYLTLDTKDLNDLGQICYFNRNKSDTHFTSFSSKRIQTEPITFSIVKANSDFELIHKSLDIELNSSLSDGRAKRQFQETSEENLNNGRPKTENFTESTDLRQQQREGQRRNSDRKSARKKPRFLSADSK